MRYRDTRRLRIVSGASLLLVLIGVPVVLGLTRPAASGAGDAPGFVAAYTHGLSSLGLAGLISLALAMVFGACLLAGTRQAVDRKYYAASSGRGLHTLKEALRTFAVVFGAAGLIVGSLSGFYAAMMQARPDLAASLNLPFLTAELAIYSLVGGGILYAAGRFGRHI